MHMSLDLDNTIINHTNFIAMFKLAVYVGINSGDSVEKVLNFVFRDI